MQNPFPSFFAMALANGHNSDLQAVGLGDDGRVYLAASQCAQTGVWRIPSFNELDFATRTYTNIVMSTGADGNLHLIGLSESQVYRIAWQDKTNGSWHPPVGIEALWPDAAFLDVWTGLGADNNFQVIGARDDGAVFVIAWQDRGGNWHMPHYLPPAWGNKIFRVRMGIGGDGNLQVIGIEKNTLEAYLVTVQHHDGSWHKPNSENSGPFRPGTQVEHLAFGKGSDGTFQVLGLCTAGCAVNGDVLLLVYQQGPYWKTDGQKGSLRPGKKFKTLTANTAYGGDLYAFGIGADDDQVYMVASHSSNGWKAPDGAEAGILGGRSDGGYLTITAQHRDPSNRLLLAGVRDGDQSTLGLPAVAAKLNPSIGGQWEPGQSLSQRDYVGSWSARLANVETAFRAVPDTGALVKYSAPTGFHFWLDHHFQGMSRYRDFDIFTHDGDTQGWIALASRRKQSLYVDLINVPNTGGRNHPGGCQVIGDYMVMGLEHYDGKSSKGAVLFYWLGCMTGTNAPRLLPPGIFPTGGAGAAAITDIDIGGDRRYLVAVYDDGAVQLFLSNGFMLDNAQCAFTSLLQVPQRLDPWGADNIALVTSQNNVPYLIALTGNDLGTENIAVLYSVDVVNKRLVLVGKPRQMHTTGVLASTGFRYGAGVRVIDSNTLQLFCCERNVVFAEPYLYVNNFGQGATAFEDSPEHPRTDAVGA